jgi:hypothetical protein
MPTTRRTSRTTSAAAIAVATGLVALLALAGAGRAADMPTATTAATPGAAATTSTSSGAAAAASTSSGAASAEKTGGDKASPERRVLTEEEILKLPILNRLNLDLERGAALLSDVRDDHPGYDESAFYYLVGLAHRQPDALKLADSDDLVAYDTLMNMPSSYRGHVVTIEGVFKKSLAFEPPPLAIWKDIKTLYRVDLRELPEDGPETYATVIVQDDPTKYLHKDDVVRVKAYFYKVLQYKIEGGKGTGLAPLLVGLRLDTSAAAATDMRSDKWTLAIGIGIIVLLAAGFFTARQITRSRQNADPKRQVYKFNLHREHRKRFTEVPGPSGPDSGPKP